jgi:hypothetical protein
MQPNITQNNQQSNETLNNQQPNATQNNQQPQNETEGSGNASLPVVNVTIVKNPIKNETTQNNQQKNETQNNQQPNATQNNQQPNITHPNTVLNNSSTDNNTQISNLPVPINVTLVNQTQPGKIDASQGLNKGNLTNEDQQNVNTPQEGNLTNQTIPASDNVVLNFTNETSHNHAPKPTPNQSENATSSSNSNQSSTSPDSNVVVKNQAPNDTKTIKTTQVPVTGKKGRGSGLYEKALLEIGNEENQNSGFLQNDY